MTCVTSLDSDDFLCSTGFKSLWVLAAGHSVAGTLDMFSVFVLCRHRDVFATACNKSQRCRLCHGNEAASMWRHHDFRCFPCKVLLNSYLCSFAQRFGIGRPEVPRPSFGYFWEHNVWQAHQPSISPWQAIYLTTQASHIQCEGQRAQGLGLDNDYQDTKHR